MLASVFYTLLLVVLNIEFHINILCPVSKNGEEEIIHDQIDGYFMKLWSIRILSRKIL